jgi:hypothetical protein
MAKDLAQHIQSWLPHTTCIVADPTSQRRILELETELAKLKSNQGDTTPCEPAGTATTPVSATIYQALQGRSAPSFDV